MKTIEADICIIGSGITAAMMAEHLAEHTQRAITVIEAGKPSTPFGERARARQRYQDYGESPWKRDYLDDQNAYGVTYGFSPSMHVGGLAMHWGGVSPRYSPEDFRVKSLTGFGADWAFSYDDLDPFYQEAEERIGIAGEQGPVAFDPRGKAYPMPALPVNYNLAQLRDWATKAGISAWSTPSAKNSQPYKERAICQRCDTCYPVCPTGAKYSPDFSWDALVKAGKVTLVTETLVRRLVTESQHGRIVRATGNRTDASGEEVTITAKTFVLAAGFVWSAHLLMLSRDDQHPDGLANRSGNVGRYLAGHRNIGGQISLPLELYPGINVQHSLVSKQFMREGRKGRYLRHDLRIWESSVGRDPRLRNEAGDLQMGDALLADWRARAKGATARVRAYYDVLPDRDSRITFDATRKNRFGDPMPFLTFKDAPESAALRSWQEEGLRNLFRSMAKAGGGEVISLSSNANDIGQEHPTGGCRMGTDPATSVVDAWGRAHDHENLWIAGAPTLPTASCTNGTLTFAAMGLRTAAGIARGG
ncbi:MAG: GMC family oxidoreductase [Gemmatimonadetes bacterium]|nr:GMC family oxidoreductase [Gemmatimonadota bacterium]